MILPKNKDVLLGVIEFLFIKIKMTPTLLLNNYFIKVDSAYYPIIGFISFLIVIIRPIDSYFIA